MCNRHRGEDRPVITIVVHGIIHHRRLAIAPLAPNVIKQCVARHLLLFRIFWLESLEVCRRHPSRIPTQAPSSRPGKQSSRSMRASSARSIRPNHLAIRHHFNIGVTSKQQALERLELAETFFQQQQPIKKGFRALSRVGQTDTAEKPPLLMNFKNHKRTDPIGQLLLDRIGISTMNHNSRCAIMGFRAESFAQTCRFELPLSLARGGLHVCSYNFA